MQFLKKNLFFFFALASKLNMGLINKGCLWYVFRLAVGFDL